MYNLFLNKENEIFNYSVGELKYFNENTYIAKNGVLVAKNLIYEIKTVENIPDDYEDGKYKYVNNTFVLNPLPEGEPDDEPVETI